MRRDIADGHAPGHGAGSSGPPGKGLLTDAHHANGSKLRPEGRGRQPGDPAASRNMCADLKCDDRGVVGGFQSRP